MTFYVNIMSNDNKECAYLFYNNAAWWKQRINQHEKKSTIENITEAVVIELGAHACLMNKCLEFKFRHILCVYYAVLWAR